MGTPAVVSSLEENPGEPSPRPERRGGPSQKPACVEKPNAHPEGGASKQDSHPEGCASKQDAHPEGGASKQWNVARVRAAFPALDQQVHGHPLVYLDNAATAQKPSVVLDAIRRYYEQDCANVHRGVHTLSERATLGYEAVRGIVRRHLNAADESEVVFTRGTTEGINLVARCFVAPRLRPGDEVIVTAMEHHANLVPWQLICQEKEATLKVVPVDQDGVLDLEAYAELLGPRARFVALCHISNVLGTINPVEELIRLAHQGGVPVLLDSAQALPHGAVDVQALDCDFLVFSSHKVFGPTGAGVLYGKRRHLDEMPPWQGGGDMILNVAFDASTFQEPPLRFEAGTPPIAQILGLGAALEYLNGLDLQAAARHEAALLERATRAADELPGVRILGRAPDKVSVLTFVVDCAHPHDIATILDQKGIAVRAGHHCAQPLLRHLGVHSTTRASFAFYNTLEEVDAFIEALYGVIELFS